MGCVMITCPVTGKPVSTGIDAELAALDQAIPFQAFVHCPACGADHGWSRSDAWISEAIPFEEPRTG
jgi:hypothetical protein